MCHTLANLEHHHFKYACSAGPATCTCTISAPPRCPSPTGSGPQPGDVFEIEAPGFGRALRNPIVAAKDEGVSAVTPL